MILMFLASWVNAAVPAAPAMQTGDIVLQVSQNGVAETIQRATSSPYSHVGLVEVAPDGVFVLEAISPVSRTPFERWRQRGRGGRFTVLRPRLNKPLLKAAVDVARRQLGKPYDSTYAWDDEKLYCSELVVKAFQRAANVTYGAMVRLDQLKLGPFERAFASEMGVRLSERVVPPGTLATDPKLDVVFNDVTPL